MCTKVQWSETQKILIVLAHPDDPEFFCGATIALWVSQGHRVDYYLFTHGEKGSDNPEIDPRILAEERILEQQRAADTLGVSSVNFLDYKDGQLESNINSRRAITRIIRKTKPTILVTSDPINYYTNGNRINHIDHRSAGQIMLDAVFPAAGNPHYFPELLNEGLQPHLVKDIWLSKPFQHNVMMDVTLFWDKKIQALLEHRSQIGNKEEFIKKMKEMVDHKDDHGRPIYIEKFYRLLLP